MWNSTSQLIVQAINEARYMEARVNADQARWQSAGLSRENATYVACLESYKQALSFAAAQNLDPSMLFTINNGRTFEKASVYAVIRILLGSDVPGIAPVDAVELARLHKFSYEDILNACSPHTYSTSVYMLGCRVKLSTVDTDRIKQLRTIWEGVANELLS